MCVAMTPGGGRHVYSVQNRRLIAWYVSFVHAGMISPALASAEMQTF